MLVFTLKTRISNAAWYYAAFETYYPSSCSPPMLAGRASEDSSVVPFLWRGQKSGTKKSDSPMLSGTQSLHLKLETSTYPTLCAFAQRAGPT